MVRHMSRVGNSGQVAASWLQSNLSTIIIVGASVVANTAIQWDRGSRSRDDIVAVEQRLNERFTALSVRLTSAEGDWKDEHDRNIEQTNELNAYRAAQTADANTRDVRTKARDEQISGIVTDVRELKQAVQENGTWRAALTVDLANMRKQLDRVVDLLEQRLPDPPADQRPPVRR